MVLPGSQPTSCPKSFKDFVTAHKIALLVALKEYCYVKHHSIRKRLNQKVSNEVTWEHTAEQNKMFGRFFLQLLQRPDMDLHNLVVIMNTAMHPGTYDLFLERLNIIRNNGIAELLNFFASLDTLLIEAAPVIPIVQKSSTLGLFVRHMLLAFDKLTFSSQTKLCKEFQVYYDDAFGPYEMGNEDGNIEMHNQPESEPEEGEDEDSPSEEFEVVASQRQSELIIAKQAALMQYNSTEILPPMELQQKIVELVKGNPELYEACFLSYMNLMRLKEYRGARDNLFHHFDRNTVVPQDPKTSIPSDDLTRSSRYAALNLAIMHALFGHNDKAIAALNEAIMLAQEVNDNVCLQFSLAWLYRLSDGDKEIMMERSISKSIELGLYALSSLSIQAMAKFKSETTALPENVFDLLMRSEIQNCQHSMTEMMGSAYMMKSGLWTYYGNSKMGILATETLLCLNTGDPSRGGVYHLGEGFCIALRNLIIWFSLRGFYKQTSMILMLCEILYPPCTEYSHIWELAAQMMKFEYALNVGKFEIAKQYQTAIAIFDKNEGKLRNAQLFLTIGNLYEADNILKKLLTDLESGSASPHFYVRTLLMRAELLYDTPNKEVALPILMNCLAKCKAHYLLGLECLTTIQIARAQLELGLPDKAWFLLREIAVPLMVTGIPYEKATFYYLCGRCITTPALKNLRTDFQKSRSVVCRSMQYFDYALTLFMQCRALLKMKMVLAYKARVFHLLGMKDQRNQAAFRYRNLEDELRRFSTQ